MGDFELIFAYFWLLILISIIYNLINLFFYKNLINRFNFFKLSKRDFYECGFKPQIQKPIQLSLQFFIICIFFLLYDIELLFFFPFISNLFIFGFYDFLLIIFYIILFILTLYIDYERHVLFWQY